jgi:hypothetical protein
MTSLGLKGISDIGITEPFPLLSLEGVRRLREDVFKPHVKQTYGRSTVFR